MSHKDWPNTNMSAFLKNLTKQSVQIIDTLQYFDFMNTTLAKWHQNM